MQLVSVQMRGSVARNGIFSIEWRHFGTKRGYFGLLWNTNIFVYCPIILYQRIEVYKVEAMDVVRFHWYNDVS